MILNSKQEETLIELIHEELLKIDESTAVLLKSEEYGKGGYSQVAASFITLNKIECSIIIASFGVIILASKSGNLLVDFNQISVVPINFKLTSMQSAAALACKLYYDLYKGNVALAIYTTGLDKSDYGPIFTDGNGENEKAFMTQVFTDPNNLINYIFWSGIGIKVLSVGYNNERRLLPSKTKNLHILPFNSNPKPFPETIEFLKTTDKWTLDNFITPDPFTDLSQLTPIDYELISSLRPEYYKPQDSETSSVEYYTYFNQDNKANIKPFRDELKAKKIKTTSSLNSYSNQWGVIAYVKVKKDKEIDEYEQLIQSLCDKYGAEYDGNVIGV
jgi:hypothetical protein